MSRAAASDGGPAGQLLPGRVGHSGADARPLVGFAWNGAAAALGAPRTAMLSWLVSDTHGRLRLPGDRDPLAGEVGRERGFRGQRGPEAAQVLLSGDAALPVGRHPRRARPQLLHHRRHLALQDHARDERDAPDRVGRARAACGERRDQEGHPPREVDARQHCGNEAPAPAARLQLSVEPRDRDLRSRVLPLESVVLPAHAREGHRVPCQGACQLVPVLPHGARKRAGRGRALLALRERRPAARHGAVVPAHHRLPGRAPRRHGRAFDLARARAPAAAQLGGEVARRLCRLPGRGLPEHPDLHDAGGHDLRRDLHGAGARAPDGRLAPHGPARHGEAQGGRSGGSARRTAARAWRARSRRKASSPAAMRRTRSRTRRSRSGSATSC